MTIVRTLSKNCFAVGLTPLLLVVALWLAAPPLQIWAQYGSGHQQAGCGHHCKKDRCRHVRRAERALRRFERKQERMVRRWSRRGRNSRNLAAHMRKMRRLSRKAYRARTLLSPKYAGAGRNPDGLRYPKQTVRYRRNDPVCQPRVRMPHQELDGKACARPQVEHRLLDGKTCQRPQIEHQLLDAKTCGQWTVKHTPLHRYQVTCDPHPTIPTAKEKFVRNLKHRFRDKNKHCKLCKVYSGVSEGTIIQTDEYPLAVVKDYVIRDRVVTFWDYKGGDTTKVRKRKIKIPTIKHLVVQVPKQGRKQKKGRTFLQATVPGRKADGEPWLEEVKLSPQETKEIMLRHLIYRNKLKWLVRLYPEERENVWSLVARYNPLLIPETVDQLPDRPRQLRRPSDETEEGEEAAESPTGSDAETPGEPPGGADSEAAAPIEPEESPGGADSPEDPAPLKPLK